MFKILDQFPNYKIFDDGRVYSLKSNKFLKYKNHRDGYYHIRIKEEAKTHYLLIHRLVALAFLCNPFNLPYVLHKDDNPKNNHVSNLEWGNQRKNMKDAWSRGRCDSTLKSSMVNILKAQEGCKKPTKWTHETYGSFYGTATDLVSKYKDLSLHHSSLCRVRRGVRSHHKGWRLDKSKEVQP